MPRKRDDDPDSPQQPLPFVQAEMTRGEETNLLCLALSRASCDLYLAQFMFWLYNATDGGRKGFLRKSYEQLAARPRGLCCSVGKARATVRDAQRLGLVRVVPSSTAAGAQGPNDYTFDLSLIRAYLRLPAHPKEGVTTAQGDALEKQGDVTTAQGPVTTAQAHIRNNTFSHLPSPPNTSIDRSKGGSIELIRTMPPRPQLIADALEREGVWRVAALRAARERSIAPLPPESLDLDPFAPLRLAHLGDVASLTRWFRRQLSIVRPLTGDSHAELVLVLAAGLAAIAIPRSRIRHESIERGRIGCFVTTLTRGLWGKVLWQVERADQQLGSLIAAYPECLTAAEWPGPRAEAVVTGSPSDGGQA